MKEKSPAVYGYEKGDISPEERWLWPAGNNSDFGELDTIVIVDFGSQYTQVIARKIRELKVYCTIVPSHLPPAEIFSKKPKGIILSGGPASVYDKGAPSIDRSVLLAGVPVLGICYGMQLMARLLGGKVKRSPKREYGKAFLEITAHSPLLSGVPRETQVWMSHGDCVERLPEQFYSIAVTDNCRVAAMADEKRKLYGLQFHPEVAHTERGEQIMRNFVLSICRAEPRWTIESIIERQVTEIREQVGDRRVILGLSGGVDSSVAAMLIFRAVGRQLNCIFVDNGLLRAGEAEEVQRVFHRQFRIPLVTVDASAHFFRHLKGVVDPERKRKIIGHQFIEAFARAARQIGRVEFLAQGTIYPDVIESAAASGQSATIKSHHNVGGLPQNMRRLKLVEPLRELFKDEVRQLGLKLGLPWETVMRHPFPGPGLAVRIIGEVSPERCRLLRQADRIFIEEIRNAGWYERTSQAFAVLLPVKTVGVMGDQRTYQNVIALRAVNTTDFMTASWTRLPEELLARVSSRIVNEVPGVNRVVYDVSTKPPATIEWE